MDSQRRHNLEKLAAAGGVASALGGAAYLYARRQAKEQQIIAPQPEILNTDKLEASKRLLINRIAVAIICLQHPDRKKIMADLEITKHKADYGSGYLSHYGLITRTVPTKHSGLAPYYVPSPELIDTLRDPEAFPFMELALQERIAAKNG